MPWAAHSTASVRVSEATAALDVEYAARRGHPNSPATDARLTIEPPPPDRIRSATALDALSVPVTLIWSTRSQSSSATSAVGTKCATPAQLTRPAIGGPQEPISATAP